MAVQVVAGLEEILSAGKLVLSPLSVLQEAMQRVRGLSSDASSLGGSSSAVLPPNIKARSLPCHFNA